MNKYNETSLYIRMDVLADGSIDREGLKCDIRDNTDFTACDKCQNKEICNKIREALDKIILSLNEKARDDDTTINIDRDTLIEKYGDVCMEFYAYYKYHFTYVSRDSKIVISIHGNQDSIRKLYLDNPTTLRGLLQATVDYQFKILRLEE